MNWVLTEPLFVIGNGDPVSGTPSNALTVLKNGNIGVDFNTPTEKLYVNGNIYTTGNLLVGTTSTYAPLHVQKWQGTVAVFNRRNSNGDVVEFWRGDPDGNKVGSIAVTTTNTTYNTTSDKRLKDNIVTTRFGLKELMQIKVRDFTYKADINKLVNTGFIAQELYEVFPDAVTKPENESGLWQVDYGRITPLVIKAVQDQQEEISALKTENAILLEKVKELETLKTELEAIKRLLLAK
jgi:hypothetical protein